MSVSSEDATGSSGDSAADPLTRVQMTGFLYKPPFGHQSAKLSKRFFILKDGFLFYYPETEKKDFEKRKTINIHPKGIVPVGGCAVMPTSLPSYPFCVTIQNEEAKTEFVLAADSEFERDKWSSMLSQSARITWRNAQLGDSMIQHLERLGLEAAIEKQEFSEKLTIEREESRTHRDRAEELQLVNEELAKEKLKAEQMVIALRNEHDLIKDELSRTSEALTAMEDQKEELRLSQFQKQKELEELEAEKQRFTEQLAAQQMANSNLSEVSNELSEKLDQVWKRMAQVLKEKEAAEKSLKLNEETAEQLRSEKDVFSTHAVQLQMSLQELSEQKALTEAELRAEMTARLEAERRWREAEESLANLERTIRDQQQDKPLQTDAMMHDVKHLKKFFENVAFEAKLDAHTTEMIKNSIKARKAATKRRARTVSQQNKGKNRTAIGKVSFESPALPTNNTEGGSTTPTSPFSGLDSISELPTSPCPNSDEIFTARAVRAMRSPAMRHSIHICLQEMSQALPSN